MFLLHSLEPVYCVTHLVNASSYHIPADYTSPGERHDFWELVYVDRGEVTIWANENKYLLKTGEMAFHRPNEYHNVLPYCGKPADIIVIAFVCRDPQMSAFEQRIIPQMSLILKVRTFSGCSPRRARWPAPARCPSARPARTGRRPASKSR